MSVSPGIWWPKGSSDLGGVEVLGVLRLRLAMKLRDFAQDDGVLRMD
jgi:hypothetical protein